MTQQKIKIGNKNISNAVNFRTHPAEGRIGELGNVAIEVSHQRKRKMPKKPKREQSLND